MKISKRSVVVRLAYMLDPNGLIPDHTDLCTLAWRCLFNLVIMLLVLTLVTSLGILVVMAWKAFLAAAAVVVIIAAIGALVVVLFDGAGGDVVRWIKGRWCPRVEIADED